MKHILLTSALSFILFFFSSGCKSRSFTEPYPNPRDSNRVIALKPNIYIYPGKDINLTIKIEFPAGGSVIVSDPKYMNGWNVFISSAGIINGRYNYLFYESEYPDLTQKNYGWVIKKENLGAFFTSNLSESNFKKNETDDFVGYWIPRLKDYDYYEIYPQYISTMDKMSILKFSIKPDNIFRLTYLIKGRGDDKLNLLHPVIEKADRQGYNSVEWGVILK